MSYLFIISTVTCFLEIFISYIVQYISFWLYSDKKSDKKLRSDLKSMKVEMNSISMMDEFARYAKLQRKFIKAQDDLKDNAKNRMQSRLKIKVIMTMLFRVLNVIFAAVLFYYYRKEPVIVFSKGLMWPVDNIFSWPSSVENSISLPVWFVLVRLAASTLPT